MRRSRSFTLALVIAGVIASRPALSGGQEAPRTTKPDTGEPQESVESLFRGLRVLSAAVTLEDSRRERAIRRVREEVMADKDLQGGYYQFRSSKRLLRESDLERGKKELRRMLRDRPEMKRHLSEDDELFQWAVRKFAGEDLPTWIEWQSTPDPIDWSAWHRIPDEDDPGLVFVRDEKTSQLVRAVTGDSHAFDQLWARAAFELHNIQGHQSFRDLHESAKAGTVSRDEYIRGIARTEYQAELRTRMFYLETYYPWARKRGITTDPENWRLNCPETFEEWIAGYPRGSFYPWQYYGRYYDDVAAVRKLPGAGVGWRKLSKQAGAAWELLKTDALLRQRARQLWNKVMGCDSTTVMVALPSGVHGSAGS